MWFEDLSNNSYIEVVAKKEGVSFPWGQGIIDRQTIRIKEIDNFKQAYSNCNLHRSLIVYQDKNKEIEIGKYPIVLDLDLDFEEPHEQYSITPNKNDLEQACLVAQQSAQILLNDLGVKNDELNIAFSGRRGFHIEINRDYAKAQEIREALRSKQREINKMPRGKRNLIAEGIILDKFHNFIRLKDTWNSWTDQSRRLRRGKCLEILTLDFMSMTTKDITNLICIH